MEANVTEYNAEEAHKTYLEENKRRDLELIEFVNDLLDSNEMTLMLEFLQSRKDKKCQTESKLEELTVKEPSLTLIQKMQQLWTLEQRLEKQAQAQLVKGKVMKQEQAIVIIRQKIEEAKKRYFCHHKERAKIAVRRKWEALEQLKSTYDIDTKHISIDSPIATKVLAYDKVRHVKALKQKQRRIEMLRKILTEYKRQRQIDAVKNKSYTGKVKRKEKTIENMEVVGIGINLSLQENVESENQEVELAVAELALEPPQSTEKSEKEQPKVEEKTKEEVKGPKVEKPKIDVKQDKNAEPTEPDLILPYVPITNERHKVSLDGRVEPRELLEEFLVLTKMQKEQKRYLKAKAAMESMPYPKDISMTWNPKVLEFQGYSNKTIYKKKIRILNGGTCEIKCRFHLVRLEEYHPCLIEVEPLGAQIVFPGKAFFITVRFSPEELEGVIAGKIIFLTYSASRCACKYFEVPLKCTPASSDVNVTPNTVKFPKMPIWEAKKLRPYKNFETINIANTGKKACRITISKIKVLFEVEGDAVSKNLTSSTRFHDEEEKGLQKSLILRGDENHLLAEDENHLLAEDENHLLAEDESHLPVENENHLLAEDNDVNECFEEVFAPFHFNCSCIDLPGKTESSLKVYFKNVDYVGYYNQKYLLKVYEKVDAKCLKCVGSQVSGSQLPYEAICNSIQSARR